MRMLMKIQMPTAAGNRAIAEGKLPEAIGKAMELLKPEAAYFFPEGGRRTAILVFDMADPSQIPAVSEPFFQAVEATVELTPVMTIEDLQAGLARLQG